MKTALLIPCLIATLGTALAHAEDAAPQPDSRLETVTVARSGKTAVMKYGGLNRALSGVQEYGEGLFRFEFRLLSAKEGKPLASPELALSHADFYRTLPVRADGLVVLPILPPDKAGETELVTNQPHDSVSLHGTLLPAMQPDQVDLATVRRMVRLAERMRSELLPWYARLFFPRMGGLRVCSAKPGWDLQWRDENGQLWALPVPEAADEKDPLATPPDSSRACMILTGKENWPDSARLAAPAGTTLSIKPL